MYLKSKNASNLSSSHAMINNDQYCSPYIKQMPNIQERVILIKNLKQETVNLHTNSSTMKLSVFL